MLWYGTIWYGTVRYTPVEYKYFLMYFMVAPCINNIKHFIVQLMHTNCKILSLLKQFKL